MSIGGLEGKLAMTVQALRDSAQAGQTALKLANSSTRAAAEPASPGRNAGLAGGAGDPSAPRGTYLDIRV